MAEPLKETEAIKYEVVKQEENVGDSVIRKTGMFTEFTLNDIAKDLELYRRQAEDLEGKIKIEEAMMENITRDRPDIAEMSEELRQVIFLYTRSFSVAKESRKVLEGNRAEAKLLRQELMKIAMETGLGMQLAQEQEEKSHD